MTTAQDGGKVVSLMHRPPLLPGNCCVVLSIVVLFYVNCCVVLCQLLCCSISIVVLFYVLFVLYRSITHFC